MRNLTPLLFFLAVAAQHLDAATNLNSKLVSKEKIIHSVALLPPTAQMIATGVIRSDIKEKEAQPLAFAVGMLMSNLLKDRGWVVDDTLFTDQAVQEKEELKYLVGYLCSRHQILISQIWPQDVTKGRCSLGNRVAALGAQMPVDAFVMVHADGERITKARAISDGAIGIAMDSLALEFTRINKLDRYKLEQATKQEISRLLLQLFSGLESHVSLRISLVDSHTGEILSYSIVSEAAPTQILNELLKIP